MIDWTAIDTVLLDLDGTLLDLHFDNYFWLTHLPQRYADIHNVALSDAEAMLHQKIHEYRGTLKWYCLDHWSDVCGINVVELKREIKHKISVRPHTKTFLQALKTANKTVILITNAHRGGLDIKLEVAGIDHWFDHIISSHDYQHPKETHAFWQHLSEHIAFSPEQTLFIDDTPSILQRAKSFGIQHLVCMNQPDSQQPAKTSEEFMGIVHFSEIMPIASDQV